MWLAAKEVKFTKFIISAKHNYNFKDIYSNVAYIQV